MLGIHLFMIVLFSLIMCADLTITHMNMKNYRTIKPDYWNDEQNFVIRWLYKKFRMPVAFTLTCLYTVPWLIILYYLFQKKFLWFLIASAVYFIAFVVHFVMAKYIAKQISYHRMLQDEKIYYMRF